MMELGSLFDIYKDAVFKKDAVLFASIFDDEVYVFDMWQWTFEGLPAWRQMAEGWFEWLGKEKCLVEFSNIQTKETGDMGYGSADVKYTGMSETGERLRSLTNRMTWVAVKNNGLWKIIHEHTSGPVDKDTMKVILER
jgi:ketosteroid isomerase-like protein